MHSKKRILSIGFLPALLLGRAAFGAVVFPVTTDSFDQANGGAIVAGLTSPTLGGFAPIAAIGGFNGGGEDGADTIFNDLNPGGINTLTFTRTLATPISGVNLFVRSDPGQVIPSGDRSTATFVLTAGTLSGSVYTPLTTLVNGAIPDNSGAGSQYTFAPTTATVFQATFTSANPNTTKMGQRVIEIDSVATPEPASLALIGLVGAGMLRRRR